MMIRSIPVAAVRAQAGAEATLALAARSALVARGARLQAARLLVLAPLAVK